MKIILTKNVKYDYTTVFEYKGEDRYPCTDDDYIVLSKPVDVDFEMIDKETAIKKQIAVIERKIKSEKTNSAQNIKNLEKTKSELQKKVKK